MSFRGDAACQFRWIVRSPPIDAAGGGEDDGDDAGDQPFRFSERERVDLQRSNPKEKQAGPEHPQSDRRTVPNPSELNRVFRQ